MREMLEQQTPHPSEFPQTRSLLQWLPLNHLYSRMKSFWWSMHLRWQLEEQITAPASLRAGCRKVFLLHSQLYFSPVLNFSFVLYWPSWGGGVLFDSAGDHCVWCSGEESGLRHPPASPIGITSQLSCDNCGQLISLWSAKVIVASWCHCGQIESLWPLDVTMSIWWLVFTRLWPAPGCLCTVQLCSVQCAVSCCPASTAVEITRTNCLPTNWLSALGLKMVCK